MNITEEQKRQKSEVAGIISYLNDMQAICNIQGELIKFLMVCFKTKEIDKKKLEVLKKKCAKIKAKQKKT
jgi:hypothetical protein